MDKDPTELRVGRGGCGNNGAKNREGLDEGEVADKSEWTAGSSGGESSGFGFVGERRATMIFTFLTPAIRRTVQVIH